VGFLETVRQRGGQLQATLERVAARSPIEMLNWRGVGLLQAIDLGAPIAEAVRDQALELGLLINAPRPHSLRFMPQLRVSTEEIEVMGERLLEAIKRVH
jgi:acetylornithine/N-succinyldiaminopimelate aminotransferase